MRVCKPYHPAHRRFGSASGSRVIHDAIAPPMPLEARERRIAG
jgi:hypothetical protein